MTVQFTVEQNQLRVQSASAKRAIRGEMPGLLGQIGRELTDSFRRDFAARSTGQSVDELEWKRDTPGTIASRVRKSRDGRRLILEKHKLEQQIREARDPYRAEKIAALRQRIFTVETQLKLLIALAQQRTKIGVDTGRLESSLKVNVDASEEAVSVSYGDTSETDYKYPFDAARRLITGQLSAELQTRVEQKIHKHYESILEQEFS